jgi:hypothetical protein
MLTTERPVNCGGLKLLAVLIIPRKSIELCYLHVGKYAQMGINTPNEDSLPRNPKIVKTQRWLFWAVAQQLGRQPSLYSPP